MFFGPVYLVFTEAVLGRRKSPSCTNGKHLLWVHSVSALSRNADMDTVLASTKTLALI